MSKSTTGPVITPASVPPHPSQRLEWIDIAKGFACLLVIVGHTISPESAPYRYIFSFHMPLFFILAGYTFKPKPLMPLVASSAKRLLLPYTIVFLLWHGMLTLKSGPITDQSILSLALTYTFASGIDLETPKVVAVGMAWFLVVLFVARILFNIAATAAQRSKKPLATLGILSLTSFALGYSLGARLGIYLPFSFDIALVAIFFMYVGYAAKQLDLFSKIKSKWLALPISVVLWLATSSNSSLELATRAYHNACAYRRHRGNAVGLPGCRRPLKSFPSGYQLFHKEAPAFLWTRRNGHILHACARLVDSMELASVLDRNAI